MSYLCFGGNVVGYMRYWVKSGTRLKTNHPTWRQVKATNKKPAFDVVENARVGFYCGNVPFAAFYDDAEADELLYQLRG